jgi:hypothetical protein
MVRRSAPSRSPLVAIVSSMSQITYLATTYINWSRVCSIIHMRMSNLHHVSKLLVIKLHSARLSFYVYIHYTLLQEHNVLNRAMAGPNCPLLQKHFFQCEGRVFIGPPNLPIPGNPEYFQSRLYLWQFP